MLVPVIFGKTMRKEGSLLTNERVISVSKCFLDLIQGKNTKIERHVKATYIQILLERPKVYKCDYCGSGFSENQNLKRHEKIHKEDFDMNRCNDYGEAFGRKDNLERHMRNVHKYVEHNKNADFPIVRDVRKFSCDICHDSFKTKDQLNRHRESIHVKQEVYDCKYCGKEFLIKDNEKRHRHLYCNLRPSKIVLELIEVLVDSM